MKLYSTYTAICLSLIGLFITACDPGTPDTDSLEGKQALLQEKQAAVMALNQEITQLEAEIAALDPSQSRSLLIPVTTAEIVPQTFQHFVKVQGKVESNRNIQVSATMGGRVTAIPVREGQAVRKGQLLAKLDAGVMQKSMEEVETALNLAKVVYQKQKNLWDQEIGTEIQYLQAKNQKESLEKKLATLQEQLSQSRIYAPISGMVDEIMPKVGEMISPGFPAFRIVNTSDLSLKASLSESYVPYVRTGDLVHLHFPTLKKNLTAKVSRVGQAINPNDRTIAIEVKLPSDPLFKANMFGEISINDQSREQALLVPLSVVQQSEEGAYVFVARQQDGGKWVAHRKDIQRGLSYEGKLEVTEGLQAGDRIVIAGYKDLSDGQEISLHEGLAEN